MLAGSIFVAVMALVLWRPRGLDPAWPAFGGALGCVACGLVTREDLWRVVARTGNATVALVGLMLLSGALEENGAFRAAAHRIARAARGDGRRLYFGLAALTVAATTLLANDGAILLMTPIVVELGPLLGLSAAALLPYLFATGFLCDALSTPLPASNLTNLILIDTLGIAQSRYVAAMALPTVAALVASLGALMLQFGRRLPLRFATEAIDHEPPFSRRSAGASGVALLLLVAGYLFASRVAMPLGAVTLLVAVGLAIFEARAGAVDGRRLVRGMAWKIVIFAMALFVVVTAVGNEGATARLSGWLAPGGRPPFLALLVVGGTVTLLAALGNNLPMLLATLLALEPLGAPGPLPFAALIGANIGSKVTPIGSLATLLWLDLLRRRGHQIGWLGYMRLAFFPTIATTVAALLALALTANIR